MMSQMDGKMPIVETGGARLGVGFVGGLVAAAVFSNAFGWGRGGFAGGSCGYPSPCYHGGHDDHGMSKIVAEMALINQNSNDRSQWEAIAKLSERAAVAETRAVDNYAFDKERSFLTNQLTKCEIREATCDFLPARKMIRPEDMGSPYHGGQNFLVSTHHNPCGGAPFSPYTPHGGCC